MISEIDELEVQLNDDIVRYLAAIRSRLREVTDDHKVTIVSLKQPNPYASYVHGKLQQWAMYDPRCKELAESRIFSIDEMINNGIGQKYIENRTLLVVESDYNPLSFEILLKLKEKNAESVYYSYPHPTPSLIPLEYFEKLFKEGKSD